MKLILPWLSCLFSTFWGSGLCSQNDLSVNQMKFVYVDKDVKDFPLKIVASTDLSYNLISHGRSGELLIEGEWKNPQAIAYFLKSKNIENYQQLNIFGCEFAKGNKGLEAVAFLQKELGISISASDDVTGIGGDWDLEVGKVKKLIGFDNYNGNLQTTTCSGSAEAWISTKHGSLTTTIAAAKGTSPDSALGPIDQKYFRIINATDSIVIRLPKDGLAANSSFSMAYKKAATTAAAEYAIFTSYDGFTFTQIGTNVNLGTLAIAATTQSFSPTANYRFIKVLAIQGGDFQIDAFTFTNQPCLPPPPPPCSNPSFLGLDLFDPILVSGTHNTVGAKYRYSNAAPGIDVLVTIDSIVKSSSNAGYFFVSPDVRPDTIFGSGTSSEPGGLYNYFQPGFGVANHTVEAIGTSVLLNSSYTFQLSAAAADGTVVTPIKANLYAAVIDNDGASTPQYRIKEEVYFKTPAYQYQLSNPTKEEKISDNLYRAIDNTSLPNIGQNPEYSVYAFFYNVDKISVSIRHRLEIVGSGSSGDFPRLSSIGFKDFPCPNGVAAIVLPTVQAINDINQTPQDVTLNGTVATNDDSGNGEHIASAKIDLDGDGVYETAVTIGGTTSITGVGTIVLRSDGSYTFNPEPLFTGQVPIIQYIIQDNDGATDSATLDINVIPSDNPTTNEPPVAQDDTYQTDQDVNAGGNVISSNDSDLDTPTGDLRVTGIRADTDGDGLVDDLVTVGGAAVNVFGTDLNGNTVLAGTITMNNLGAYTFNPTASFVGEVPVDYTISDPEGGMSSATLTITVNAESISSPVNHTYANDDANVGSEDLIQTGNIITNDNDPEGNDQDVSRIDTNGDGIVDATPVAGTPVTITQGGVTVGTLTINPETGAYSWDPVPGFIGTVAVPYTATDGTATDIATLYLTTTIPTPPTINPDINVTFVNTSVTGSVKTNDIVPSGTTYGTPVPAPGFSNPNTNLPSMNSDGTYSFVSDLPGVYNFRVPVCASGQTTNCPTSLLTITVSDVNTPTTLYPTASTDIASTIGSTPVTLRTLANDNSVDNTAMLVPGSVKVTTAPKNGTATVDLSTGNITYTPNAGFVGNDTLFYEVCDDYSQAMRCATAMQIITVKPVGSPNSTLAADDYANTPINTPVTKNVLINDTDPEGNTQTVTPQTDVLIPGVGTYSIAADGSYTFTPATDYTGPASFVYDVCDNNAAQACTKATAYFTVSPNAVILPMGIKDFAAAWQSNFGHLSWKGSGLEESGSRYEIERSTDGVTYSSIVSLNADAAIVNYTYSDKQVADASYNNRTIYYRIKYVEANGSVSYSSARMLDGAEPQIGLYPNPSKGKISFRNLQSVRSISLWTMDGKLLRKIEVVNRLNLSYDLGNHADGAYRILLELNNGQRKNFNISIIK